MLRKRINLLIYYNYANLINMETNITKQYLYVESIIQLLRFSVNYI